MYFQLVALRVACVVFAVVALAQLVRLLAGAEVSVDGHLIPLWVSGIAVLLAGGLALGWVSYLTVVQNSSFG